VIRVLTDLNKFENPPMTYWRFSNFSRRYVTLWHWLFTPWRWTYNTSLVIASF